MRIAFIGLGRMGWHLAGHLAAAGHELRVFDIDPAASARWTAEFSGTAAGSVAEAVEGCTVVCSSVPADPQLRAIWDAAQGSLADGAIWVDHSTASSPPRPRRPGVPSSTRPSRAAPSVRRTASSR